MKRTSILLNEPLAEWQKRLVSKTVYGTFEEESALAATLIEARSLANLTQEQVAKRMGTTQATIARLESGHSPSTRTLERYAQAARHRLRIALVPEKTPVQA
jgi:transcriptional regulator with XRE-family HTH domain